MTPALSLIQEPLWLQQMAVGEPRKVARLKWLLDLCALYATEDGKMTDLSLMCGFSSSAIGKARYVGAISPDMAIRIEQCLGRAWITREVLLPELFSIEG